MARQKVGTQQRIYTLFMGMAACLGTACMLYLLQAKCMLMTQLLVPALALRLTQSSGAASDFALHLNPELKVKLCLL